MTTIHGKALLLAFLFFFTENALAIPDALLEPLRKQYAVHAPAVARDVAAGLGLL